MAERTSDSTGPSTSPSHDSELRLGKKPNTISSVWNYFGIRLDEKGNPDPAELEKPVCKLCKRTVAAKRSNTTNLHTHLEDHHPDVYASIAPTSSHGKTKRKVQPTLTQFIEKGKKYDPKSQRVQELNRAIARYIAKDMQPFHTVERQGFREMVHALDPMYELPSRKYFSTTEIPKLYMDVKESIVKPAVQNAQYFSASTDLWTSCSNHPYLSFTIHFLTKDWELKSYCLDTVPLFEDHTGQNLADALQDILANWELKAESLVVTTTDNGSNFVLAFQLLEYPRLSCFGHNLDLAINKSLQLD